MQLSRLPPNVVQYFTNPESIEPPDFQLLVPFVDSALPLAYGVFGVQLFHVCAIIDLFLLISSLSFQFVHTSHLATNWHSSIPDILTKVFPSIQ